MDAETQNMIRAMADRMETMERELSTARNQQHLDDTGFIALARRTISEPVTMAQLRTRLVASHMLSSDMCAELPDAELESTLELVNYFVAGGR